MGMMTRSLLGIVLATTLAACATKPMTREYVATPAHTAKLGEQSGITVRLRNGTEIEMGAPVDYGDAYCGPDGCALKSEIATIIKNGRVADPGGTAAAAGTIALFAVPLTLVTLAFAAKSLDSAGSSVQPDATTEPLTPELETRIWLEGLVISEGRITARYGNACVDASQFATDVQGLEWLVHHRDGVARSCLSSAANFIFEHPRPELMQPAMELWARVAVQNRWDVIRCRSLPPWMMRLTPPGLDSFGRRGDARFPAIIEAVLADPATYDYEIDLVAFCEQRGGVAPEIEWRERLAQVKAAGPFPGKAPFQ
jgi:hypothetical protein